METQDFMANMTEKHQTSPEEFRDQTSRQQSTGRHPRPEIIVSDEKVAIETVTVNLTKTEDLRETATREDHTAGTTSDAIVVENPDTYSNETLPTSGSGQVTIHADAKWPSRQEPTRCRPGPILGDKLSGAGKRESRLRS